MERIDPHGHKERYLKWKQSTQPALGISEATLDTIRRFVLDMELGLHTSRASRRGPRSFIRLNTLRTRAVSIARMLHARFDITDVTQVTEEQVHALFSDMRNGVLRKADGQPYVSVADFIKDFKTFWHWHMEVSRLDGKSVRDITFYLDATKTKPKWVYLTESETKRLCEEAKYEYRVLITFLVDSGIRSPTELMNVRVRDLTEGFRKLHIREEVSKTFGRKINLLLSSDLLREFVKTKHLRDTDPLFAISPPVVNRYLKRLAARVLGTGESPAGEHYDKLTLYDFRHIAACYWLPRYKSESALKYRFGWKKTERIHYYTELLGMKDDITEEDLLVDASKTAIEQKLAQSDRDKQVMQDKIDALQNQMAQILQMTNKLVHKVG